MKVKDIRAERDRTEKYCRELQKLETMLDNNEELVKKDTARV